LLQRGDQAGLEASVKAVSMLLYSYSVQLRLHRLRSHRSAPNFCGPRLPAWTRVQQRPSS